jgi:ABC-2 type transport system permease protein
MESSSGVVNHGSLMIQSVKSIMEQELDIPLEVKLTEDRSEAVDRIKNKDADALIIIPSDFTERIQCMITSEDEADAEVESIQLEFVGDLTNVNYMVTAVWANEIVNDYVMAVAKRTKPVEIRETSLGVSGSIDEFDMVMPGILILSIIMLMFSATIAMVAEVENKTMVRLKLSQISTTEFLSGVSLVQVMVGLISIVLTLLVAVWLGFDYTGSLGLMFVLAVLTSLSIIAFSLILAAVTKTVNEVLIVGNFPLFLFMFFTGAAFPLKGHEFFTVAGYPITLQGLMSPTHAITALKKVLIMNMGLRDIIPEIMALVILIILYFLIGVWAFRKRHMRIV